MRVTNLVTGAGLFAIFPPPVLINFSRTYIFYGGN